MSQILQQDKVLVVAEIGNNHEGNFEVAQELVRQAAQCGVDAVKFQTFKTELYVSQADSERFNRLKSFELTQEQFRQLAQLAKSFGILFLSTPFDIPSAIFLGKVVDCFKVSSGDNNFYPLLAAICKTSKPLIISTGLSDLAQVQKTVEFVQSQWRSQGKSPELAVLHCVSSYPVPAEQANLAAIPFLAEKLKGLVIGYSDHTIGIQACLTAVALGARVIEKHFTLDHHYSDFRDHQLSADPEEMRQLVTQIPQVQSLLGQSEKVLQACEVGAVQLIRRSIAAAANLPAGHQLTRQDLVWLRPGFGIPPGQEDLVLGKTLTRSLNQGEPIVLEDLE